MKYREITNRPLIWTILALYYALCAVGFVVGYVICVYLWAIVSNFFGWGMLGGCGSC